MQSRHTYTTHIYTLSLHDALPISIERDLRSQYGAEYRVIGSDSPEGALEVLKQLKVRNDNVALLLADQRMPRMDGVEFLDRKSTRLNSSHVSISYAVFCLK